jgi:hypothetical protein
MTMMTERMQRALDGELPIEELEAGEVAELERHRALFTAALEPLDALPEVDVSAAVERRIAALGVVAPAASAPAPALARPGVLRRAAQWLWSPRPISLTLRPALGMAAALVLGAVVLLGVLPGGPAPEPVGVAVEQPGRVLVEFRFGAAQASEVALVGDFNGWQPSHSLYETAPGVWSVVVALEPGVYDYSFIVDGETWQLDPLAPQVADGFGGANSRLAVLPPDRSL